MQFLRVVFLMGDPKLWDPLRALAKQDMALAPLGVLTLGECEEAKGKICESVYYHLLQLLPDDSIPHLTVGSTRPLVDASSAATLAFELAGTMSIELHHRWPLSEIYTASTMEAYNQCLRFLLQLYCVRWAAEDVWSVMTKSRILEAATRADLRPWIDKSSPSSTPTASPEKRQGPGTGTATGAVGSGRPSRPRAPAVSSSIGTGRNRCFAGMVWTLHTVGSLQTFYMEKLHQHLCQTLHVSLAACHSILEIITSHDAFLAHVTGNDEP